MTIEQGFTANVMTLDAYGRSLERAVTMERALTIYLNRREIVTLMTMGSQAETLVLGYLLNQRLLDPALKPCDIKVQVDWQISGAAVQVPDQFVVDDFDLSKKTVTSGCGQGTVYGDLLEDLDAQPFQLSTIRQSQIYQALQQLSAYNEVYRSAGAVHGCALLDSKQRVLTFVEDVGRHNAVDSIAGTMWQASIERQGLWLYTTGRLTSEMVIKSVQMGVSVLLSRSGVTAMGVAMAQKYNVILIARAKGKYFIIYNGTENVELDQMPRDESDSSIK